jgi:hypothetical protein
MLCILEIACLTFGITILVRGRVSLSAKKEVRGGPAYLIGLLLIAILPLAAGIGLVVGIQQAQQGNAVGFNPAFALIDLGVVGVLGISALLIALATAKPKLKPKRRRSAEEDDYDDHELEDDDRPRRPRRDELDDDEDERPRGRRRDELDEDDDRPRRKRDDLDDRAR